MEAPEIDMEEIGEVYEYLEAQFPDHDISDSSQNGQFEG
jgi:hypothetical protein